MCKRSAAHNRFFKQGLWETQKDFGVTTRARLAGVRAVGRRKQDRETNADGKSYCRVILFAAFHGWLY
jgi:hypothetical protein